MRSLYLPVLCLICALALISTGCDALLEREFNYTAPHARQWAGSARDEAVTVRDYEDLKWAVMQFITTGMDEGSVRMTGFEDDVYDDLTRVCREVQRQEPHGAYAVDSIAYEVTRIISDFEVRFKLAYRRSGTQLADIRHIYTADALDARITEALSAYEASFALYTEFYDERGMDTSRAMERLWQVEPDLFYGVRELKAKTYPESGRRRILEVEIARDAYEYVVTRWYAMADEVTNELVAPVRELPEAERAILLWAALTERAVPIQTDAQSDIYNAAADTSYGALVEGEASARGYGAAYLRLCRAAGLEAMIVSGGTRGTPHVWNLVRIDGAWYHTDVALDELQENTAPLYLLRRDDEMRLDHTWDAAAYPVCDGAALMPADYLGEAEVTLSEEDAE